MVNNRFGIATFITSFLVVLALTNSCLQDNNSREVQSYLEFLYDYMTPDDDLLHTRTWWETNVQKSLEVRHRMNWDITEDQFKFFVLPLRACNERIDDFRILYADTLCRRVEGMSMRDAALEINHWCLEQAVYEEDVRPSDTPTGTVALGAGTCTQLSELLVCALRAAGLPARMVNVMWPHKQGSHSWVEVWAEGRWQYMGGTEPSPILDFSWIYDVAPQVMLTVIYVFGDYNGPETVIGKTDHLTAISNLSKYAPVKNLHVAVSDAEGNPARGVDIGFLIGPDSHKRRFHAALSDENGTTSLEVGCGECVVLARQDSLFGVVKAYSSDTLVNIVLNLSESEAMAVSEKMTLLPPPPGLIPGTPDDLNGLLEPAPRNFVDDSIRIATHAKK